MIQQLDPIQDRGITLYGISWDKFVAIASLLEDYPIHLTYLDGTVDIMTFSAEHEESKKTIGLLLEVYLRFKGIRFYSRGGYTLGSRESGARGEPDESYNIETKKDIPDIAIEVILSNGDVDKLEKYKRWGVPEVWFYQDSQLFVYHLGSSGYEQVTTSELLPELDLYLFVQCLDIPDQYDATIAFSEALRQ